MLPGDPAGDRQAETAATGVHLAGKRRTVEPVKDVIQLLDVDPGTGIPDLDLDSMPALHK